ncbi:hypothetical protein [Psychrobacter sp. I-STPA6b]|uniref:hypothetical protein n=1 Tax=Psychrobacter sp. I-STPA6b TaxID=2585718 RepID=UPI001D0CD352|nr:hypothetical protein [Psychrobacter sp. I-STPA6b]
MSKNIVCQHHILLTPYLILRGLSICLLFGLTIILTGCGGSSYESDYDNGTQAILRLSTEEQALFYRYVARMQSIQAEQRPHRVTIAQALSSQREYEQKHADSDKHMLDKRPKERYALILLPEQITNAPPNTPRFSISLYNNSDMAVKTFQGTIEISLPTWHQPQTLTIPLTQFLPPIAPQGQGILAINDSLQNASILRDIKQLDTASIHIVSAKLTLDDNQVVQLPITSTSKSKPANTPK